MYVSVRVYVYLCEAWLVCECVCVRHGKYVSVCVLLVRHGMVVSLRVCVCFVRHGMVVSVRVYVCLCKAWDGCEYTCVCVRHGMVVSMRVCVCEAWQSCRER